ncbi:hypothetical protein BD413DRAFT_491096 [Trametes elegans]|nr:hypothetical protein BD413DRAFT_491096 [Trametes elegans]
MSAPLYYRQSNSSEESPLTDDRSESEHEHDAPLDVQEDHEERPLDPRNSALSLVSGAGYSLDDRRHSRRKDFDRKSLTNRDFFKYLVDEGQESKKLRKVLHAALERLDSETRRAQEAERRALELAQRFKIVNDSRLAAQQELDRAHAELRMYKVQLDNAQREILRGSDLLKDIEAQRDSAEASAARARSTARRLKEEQLMMKAREEGRKEGYREGLQRGYQQARGGTLDGQSFDVPPAGLGPIGGLAGDAARTDPLDDLQMMNFPSPLPPANVALSSAFGSAMGDVPLPQPDSDTYGAGAQGSRFREIIGSPSASTLRSAPLGAGTRPGDAQGWTPANDDEVRYIRPTTIHNAPPSPKHADYSVPPDGYIPAMGPDQIIPVPPPHELSRPPSMASVRQSEDAAPAVNARDYAYPPRQRASPRSYSDSLPSTTISQFDLVSSPHPATRGLRDRNSGLSAIPEVSSSMEYSPGTEGRFRSSIVPETTNYSTPDVRPPVGDAGNVPGMRRSRSRETNQRIADDLRYSDPDEMEQWRRSSASQVRTLLGSGSRDRYRTPSSADISIHIEPPSGPGSNMSPSSMHHGMLSPSSSSQALPPRPTQPHSGGTPTPAYTNGYAGGGAPPAAYGYGSSNPMPPPPSRGYPGYPTPGSSSTSSFGRPMSHSRPPSYGGGMGDGGPRSKTPSARSPSAFGSERPPSTRPVTPGQPYPRAPSPSGGGYHEPQRVPSVLRSPSRQSNRQSLQPDFARPSSRASADHHRSLSLNAGSTPATVPRPLSGASQLRRVPSASSINSETSRKEGGYEHYDPHTYVDAAFLASAEDLTSMQSPGTRANTRANASAGAGAAYAHPGPSKLRSASPSMSYSSFRS